MRKLTIIQRVLPHYRHSFFRKLNIVLRDSNIELKLFYGQERDGQVPKTIDINDDFSIKTKNYYLSFLGKELVFNSLNVIDVLRSDVIIVEQSNRILSNYLILLLCKLTFKKFVLWGHGRNYQSQSNNPLESFKTFFTKFSDAFIAYTEGGKNYLIKNRYPERKIFHVNNSVQVDIPKVKIDEETAGMLFSKRAGVFPTSNMVVYCGGMYKHKRLQFLIESLSIVKRAVPDLSVCFVGDGPDDIYVKEFEEENSTWVYYAGFVTGEQKASIFSLSKLQLMPGLVGLAVVDSFSYGVPIVTTDITIHSPEIEYIENKKNGLITLDNVEAYSKEVAYYLTNKAEIENLKNGCLRSADIYTLDNMVINFRNAVASILAEQ